MDCAVKFEKDVAALPGVASAEINAMTGKLKIDGSADLEAIRKLGAEHNYTVEEIEKPKPKTTILQVTGIT